MNRLSWTLAALGLTILMDSYVYSESTGLSPLRARVGHSTAAAPWKVCPPADAAQAEFYVAPPIRPHHAPGDLYPHTPYVAHPHFYYYFRPYNWYHIPAQQESVMSYGGDPRHPYANREFQEIYHGLE